jgi:hypothetical protein
MTIGELSPYQDNTVVLQLSDGEISTAKIAFGEAEYEDIVVDIISSTGQTAIATRTLLTQSQSRI